MKSATKQVFPRGWNERKVRAVVAHYDRQTDAEGAKEIETAPEASGETWMCVPTGLVGIINGLIIEYQRRHLPARARNGVRKTRRD